jgi:hypothetical protein
VSTPRAAGHVSASAQTRRPTRSARPNDDDGRGTATATSVSVAEVAGLCVAIRNAELVQRADVRRDQRRATSSRTSLHGLPGRRGPELVTNRATGRRTHRGLHPRRSRPPPESPSAASVGFRALLLMGANEASQSRPARRSERTTVESAHRSGADTCFALAEQVPEDAGPAHLVLVQFRPREVAGALARASSRASCDVPVVAPSSGIFIGRVLRDTRHRLHRERRPYAARMRASPAVPARRSRGTTSERPRRPPARYRDARDQR